MRPLGRYFFTWFLLMMLGDSCRLFGQNANVIKPTDSKQVRDLKKQLESQGITVKYVEPAKDLSTFPPDEEKKFKSILEDLRSEKDAVWADRMKDKVDELAKEMNLSKEKADALEAATKPIIQHAVDHWMVEIEKAFRNELQMQGIRADAILDQVAKNAKIIARNNGVGASTAPDESDEWVQAVHSTLSPDQTTQWDKDREAKKAEVEKEFGEALAPALKSIQERENAAAMNRCTEIENALSLDVDRKVKLEDIGKRAAEGTASESKNKLESFLKAMNPAVQQMFLQNITNGQTRGIPGLTASFDDQPAWKDGLAGFLTDPEKAKLQDLADGRVKKRVQTMGKVLILLLDEKLALTADQREKLEPLAARLVKDVPNLFPDAGADYVGCNLQTFFDAAQKATDAELKPILDDVQIRRLRKLVPPPADPTPDAPPQPPETATEPEYVEKSISRVFYDREKSERAKILEDYTLKAEDVIRQIGVGPESSTRLQIAARGMAEKKLTMWKFMTEQQTRNQLQDVNPQNIDQRLASLQNYFYQVNRVPQADDAGIWESALKSALTPAQQITWKQETDDRLSYHQAAVAELVISNLDHFIHLSEDQMKGLQPLIKGVVGDYDSDIPRVFASGDGTPWYLTNGFELMPLSGVPDDKLKAILTPAQMTAWSARPEFASGNNTWGVVKQVHDQRLHSQGDLGQ